MIIWVKEKQIQICVQKKSSNGFMFGKMASTNTHTSLTYLALQVLKQHYVCTDSIQRLRAASEI
jgi:hypothetical protein